MRLQSVSLFLAALLLATLSLVSCASTAQGTVTTSGAMDVKLSIQLLPAFAEYLASVQGFSEGRKAGEPRGPLFDEAVIRSVLAAEPGLRLNALKLGDASVSLDLNVASLERLANQGRLADTLDYQSRGSANALSFVPGRQLTRALIAYVRPDDAKNLESMIPREGSKISRAAYEAEWLAALLETPKELELVTVNGKVKEKVKSWYSEAEIKAMFAASRIVVSLQFPRPVQSVKGAVKTGANTVRFEADVLELLTRQPETPVEIVY